jgi:branched-chain amino acid transport system substrate-binding protein
MRIRLSGLSALAAMFIATTAVSAQSGAVRVGLVAPFSGPSAEYGQEFQRGMQLYLDEIGGQAGGTRIELLVRDDASQPERSKQLSQELVVRDKVSFLSGYVTTPSALAVAPIASEAKVPTVILNAATGVITRRSPYFARVSHTQWQGAFVIGEWAVKNGIKSAYTIVADYAPGHDARDAFRTAFTKGGGTILGEVGFPLNTTDFAPFVQRAKDAKPDAIYIFTPVGPPTVALVKTYASLGLKDAGIRLLGTGDTDESVLPAIGDSALGLITAYHYSSSLDTPENKRFVEAYRKKYGPDGFINFASVAGYVGMNAIADAVKKHGAGITGDQAMEALKGWKAPSPKGPVAIDAKERDIVQNIYIRRVERVGNGLGNVAFETVPAVGDLWKVHNPN